MELDVQDDIPDLIDMPKDIVSDFDYQFLSGATIHIIDEILQILLRYAHSRLSKVHKNLYFEYFNNLITTSHHYFIYVHNVYITE